MKIASDHVLALAETVAHVGHWSWNSDTKEVVWSPECFNIFGRDPDTWIPTEENFRGDMPDEDREKLEQANLRGFESGEPFELEYRYFRGGSRDDVRWIRVCCDFLVDADGTKHMVGIAQDVTASKQAETALQESERRFKDIAEASGDWFWETDADHRFTWFSDRVEEVAGVPVEFHIGKSRLELAADQVDQEKWRAHLETLEARRPFRDFRYLRRGHDGRLQHMSSSGVPVFDAEGNFKGYRGAGTDISAEVEAEQLAASAQESFMAAIESVSDGFALFDADDRMVFCNSRFKELNPDLTPKIVPGVTFEELLRENIAAERILDALGDEEAFIRERMERHRNPRSPLVQQRRDGRWLELREERTAEGSTFLVNTDITERILAEEALRESEERFRTLVEYAPEAITMLDVDTGLYVDANPMAETLHGLPRDALIGKLGPADLSPEIQPDGRPSAEAAPDYLSRALAGEFPRFEWMHLTPEGRETLCEVSLARLPDPHRNLVRASIHDITERKRAEEALRVSEAQFHLAEKIAHLCHWISDKAFANWTYASPNTEALFGVQRDELLGSHSKFISFVHSDDRDLVLQAYSKIVANPKRYELNYRIVRGDGEIRHFYEVGEAETNDAGDVGHYRGTTQDVTDLKRVEEEIRRLNAELEQRVEARTAELRAAQAGLLRQERLATLGQLTATVSHELRNPLGTIRTSIFTLRNGIEKSKPVAQRSLERIDRSIQRCDQIVDELLDFTRISELEPVATPLDAWLGETLNEQAVPAEITLRRDFGLGAMAVPLDRNRLRRAIINVFDNACQAMSGEATQDAGADEPVLTVRTRERQGRVEIIFEDLGPGIPPDVYENIFEPLFSTKGFGVGLGLPVVKQIMEQHGGGIEIESQEGQGTRVCLWLPPGHGGDSNRDTTRNPHHSP